MSLIYVNGKGYADDAPVAWEDAEAAGGFYFSRARYLGLPQPPAILFYEEDPRYLAAMGRYHERFSNAEARQVMDDDPEMKPWRHQEDGL